MSEPVNGHAVDQERALEHIRQQATLLISKINPGLLNAIHDAVRGEPTMIGAASLAAALADVLASVSKTEVGVDKNCLIVSEVILRIARSGFKETADAAPGAAGLRLHS